MFWVGLAIAVVGGLLGVQLWRNWIQSRLRQATDQAFDITRSMLLIIGALIAVAGYMQSGREITGVRQELTDTQQKQAAAEQALREVQEHQRPRTLSEEQRGTLVQQLQDGPKGQFGILALAGDVEADQFGHELEQVLNIAGWTREPLPFGFARYQPTGKIPEGLEIFVGRTELAPHGEFLWRIFRAVGIDVQLTSNQYTPDGLVHLIVGYKSRP